jgi:Tfp pilus assembly protein FimT
LLELIVVMVVLTVLLALVAPTLSSSFRGRNLDQAGAQLLALTEYGRDEAISQGVPMDVWLNPATGQYGVNAKAGYPGDATRDKQYTLDSDLHFDAAGATVAAPAGQLLNLAEFEPDGTLDPSSLASMRIVGHAEASISVAQTPNGYGYELQSGTR